MKKNNGGLRLKSETVRALSEKWLVQAQGGQGAYCGRLSCQNCESTSTVQDGNCPGNIVTDGC